MLRDDGSAVLAGAIGRMHRAEHRAVVAGASLLTTALPFHEITAEIVARTCAVV